MGDPDAPHSVLYFDPDNPDYFDVFPHFLVSRIYTDLQEMDPGGFSDYHGVREALAGKSFQSGLFSQEPYSTYIRHAAVNLYLATKKAGTDLANALKYDALKKSFKKTALSELLEVEGRVRKAYADLFSRAWTESRRSVLTKNNQLQYVQAVRNFGLEPETFLNLNTLDAIKNVVFNQLDRLLDPKRGGTRWNVTKIFDALFLLTGKRFGGVGINMVERFPQLFDVQGGVVQEKDYAQLEPEASAKADVPPIAQITHDSRDPAEGGDGPWQTDVNRLFMQGSLDDLAVYSAGIQQQEVGETLLRGMLEEELKVKYGKLSELNAEMTTRGLGRRLTGRGVPEKIKIKVRETVFGERIWKDRVIEWGSLPTYITDMPLGEREATLADVLAGRAKEAGEMIERTMDELEMGVYPKKHFLRNVYEKKAYDPKDPDLFKKRPKKLFNEGDLIPADHPDFAWTDEEKAMRDEVFLEIQELRETRAGALEEQKTILRKAWVLYEQVG